MSLKIVIADDEPLVRRSVRRFLAGRNVTIVEECGSGAETLAALHRHGPDLLFLDIEMPDANGLASLARFGQQKLPATIIITAYERYAVEAYDLNVADYILKPFGKERFDRGFARGLSRISAPALSSFPGNSLPVSGQVDRLLELCETQQAKPQPIPIPTRFGGVVLIRPEEIEYVEAEENSLVIHCRERTYELRETLSGLHKRLGFSIFARIHRSTLVNVNCVREIHPWCNGHHVVTLTNGRHLRMSRYQSQSVERLLRSGRHAS